MKKLKFALVLILTLTILSLPTSKIFAWKNPLPLEKYQQETVEFRAAWVATVFNLDMKMQEGTNEYAIQDWKNRYLAMLDTLQQFNMNAIVFQIRPANDAFYPSKYNPWSEYLAGYGVNPGWDPLKWMIEVTHERGIEYHAWLNPYRVTAKSYDNPYLTKDAATNSNRVVEYDQNALNKSKEQNLLNKTITGIDNPVFKTGEELYHSVLLGTGNQYVLNPAAEETIEHLKLTIEEIVDNYDIDGIHFDDYFYPDDATYSGTNSKLKGMTFSVEPYVELSDYQKYTDAGGNLSIYDWRRDNVNKLIKSLSDLIREKNETKKIKCAFGISPAARWAPSIESCGVGNPRGAVGGMDDSCNNYYSYSDLYADTYKWAKEEWVDYILPQNYTNLDSNYISIAQWWSNALSRSDTKLYIGTPSYKIDEWADALELYYQIRYNQSSNLRVDGYCMYDYTSLVEGKGANAMNAVGQALWKTDALTPLYDYYEYDNSTISSLVAPDLTCEKTNTYKVSLHHTDKVKAYEILSFDEGADVTDFSQGKRCALKIDTDCEFELVTEAGKQYIMVAYNESNKLQSAYIKLVFPPEKENEAPIIKNVSKIEKEYLTGSTFDVTINAEDPEGLELNYQVYVIEKGDEILLNEGSIPTDTNTITVTVGPYYYTLSGKLKIVVGDGKKQAEVNYDFSVVNEYSQPSEPTPEPTKKGCKKKSIMNISFLIGVSAFIILLRKKEK